MSLLQNLCAGKIPFFAVQDNEILAVRLGEERNNPNSQESRFLKAFCLMFGKCIPKDVKLAFQLFRQLSDEGHVAAKYHIGCLFLNGEGIENNLDQALQFTIQAAESGHFLAIINLSGFYWNGICVPVNKEMAVHWMHRALEVLPNHPIVLYQLALALWSGDGIAMDKERAITLYLQAAERKYSHSAEKLCEIAEDYLNGHGVEKNKEKGGEILVKLLQMGYDFVAQKLFEFGQAGLIPMEKM
jgi:TPR repeat protein